MLGQLLLLLSGIIVARLLGPESRGHLQLFALAPALVAHVGTLGLPTAVTYFVARKSDSASAIWARLFRPVLALTLALMLGMALVMTIALAGASEPLRLAGFIVILAVPGVIGQRFGLALLQGQQRFLPFNILRTLHVAGYSFAALALLLSNTGDLPLVAAIWTASMLVAGAVTLIFAVATTRTGAPAQTSLKEMTRFGSRSLLGALSPVEALRLDQIALAIVAGPAALGIYVVGLAFTNLPRFIAQSIGMVAYPRISSTGVRGFRQAIPYVLAVAVIGGIIVTALEVMAPWLVPLLFGAAFDDAVAVTRIALLAAYLLSLRRVLTDCAHGLGWPGIGSIAEVVSSTTAVVLIVALGVRWGAEGAAWGLTVGAAVGLATLLLMLRFAIRDRVSDDDRQGQVLDLQNKQWRGEP